MMTSGDQPRPRATEPELRAVALERSRVWRISASLLDLVSGDMPDGCDFSRSGTIDAEPDWLWCRNEGRDLQRCAEEIDQRGGDPAVALASLAELDARVRVLADRVEQTLARLNGTRPGRFDQAATIARLALARARLQETITAAAAALVEQADVALSMPTLDDCEHADAELLADAHDAIRRAGMRADYVYGEALRALGTVAAAHSKATLASDGSYLSAQLELDAENADSEVFHLTGLDLDGRPGTGDGTGSVEELRALIVRAADAVHALRSSVNAEV